MKFKSLLLFLFLTGFVSAQAPKDETQEYIIHLDKSAWTYTFEIFSSEECLAYFHNPFYSSTVTVSNYQDGAILAQGSYEYELPRKRRIVRNRDEQEIAFIEKAKREDKPYIKIYDPQNQLIALAEGRRFDFVIYNPENPKDIYARIGKPSEGVYGLEWPLSIQNSEVANFTLVAILANGWLTEQFDNFFSKNKDLERSILWDRAARSLRP